MFQMEPVYIGVVCSRRTRLHMIGTYFYVNTDILYSFAVIGLVVFCRVGRVVQKFSCTIVFLCHFGHLHLLAYSSSAIVILDHFRQS